MKKEFAISFPYFDLTICTNDDERDSIEDDLNYQIKERIPNGADSNLFFFT